MDERLLVCRLLPARRRARAAALAEMLALLAGLGARAEPGGPLSEEPGVFWVSLPAGRLEEARARLPRLGYTRAVGVLEPQDRGALRWRGARYALHPAYELDPREARERAPDRRTFVIESGAGVRAVRGYRGTGAPSERRALPAADARLLVNLALPPAGGLLLDPFAGAGGIVIEATAAGASVLSCDIDPAVRHGLAALGARHCVGDARALPFGVASVDAVATEPPYHRDAEPDVVASLAEIARVLRSGSRAAVLAAAAHAPALRDAASRAALEPLLDAAIDRRGTPVVALAWEA